MADIVWKTSPWDHQQHAFRPDEIGEVTARAICDHSARSNRLAEPADADRQCMACLLIHGGDLADKHGDLQWRP